MLTISSISPSSGPAIGGTAVTVTGSHFASGTALTMGGSPALNVTVIDSTTIVATTPPAAGGPVDVTVLLGGQVATLRGGYTYLKDDNAAPVISSITAQGTAPNAPPNFANLDEEIDVAAAVTDAETSVDQLSYEWSADAGTFSGTGPSVKWRAPRDVARTPANYALTVTVVEQYATTDEDGAVVTRENRATESAIVRVHNSAKEVADLAGEFLNDFSNSAVSPETATRNFSSDQGCGKAQELADVRDNRAKYTITAKSLAFPATVRFNFGGSCTYRSRRGDACVQLGCSWTSTVKATGATEIATGTCWLTAVYETGRWQMCWSDFQGTTTSGLRFAF